MLQWKSKWKCRLLRIRYCICIILLNNAFNQCLTGIIAISWYLLIRLPKFKQPKSKSLISFKRVEIQPFPNRGLCSRITYWRHSTKCWCFGAKYLQWIVFFEFFNIYEKCQVKILVVWGYIDWIFSKYFDNFLS